MSAEREALRRCASGFASLAGRLGAYLDTSRPLMTAQAVGLIGHAYDDSLAMVRLATDAALAAPSAPAEPSAEARDERAAFEAWAVGYGYRCTRTWEDEGIYQSAGTNWAWAAWQAAIAAQKGGAA